MKSLLLAVALLMPACAVPNAGDVMAAEAVVAAHDGGADVPPDELANARAVLDAHERDIDWLGLGLAALATIAGVPALAGRGRQLIKAGVGAALKGDYQTATHAAVSYGFGAHSTRALNPQKK